MPLDYNIVYLVGVKDDAGWTFGPGEFMDKAEAEALAEKKAIATGNKYVVFKSVSYYERDEITASRTYCA